jgi:hypothetical protein
MLHWREGVSASFPFNHGEGQRSWWKTTMAEQKIAWSQDGIDPGWFIAEGVGSVRSRGSYRPGGWWFLAAWLPDTKEHDVGPFRTRALAFTEAERLTAEYCRQLKG